MSIDNLRKAEQIERGVLLMSCNYFLYYKVGCEIYEDCRCGLEEFELLTDASAREHELKEINGSDIETIIIAGRRETQRIQ